MFNIKSFIYFAFLFIIASLLCTFSFAFAKSPDSLSIMTYDVGSSGYLAYGMVGDAILEKYDTRLRAIPAGNDVGRMNNLRAGKTQFAGQGLDIYFATYGLDRYARRARGPMPIRVIWLARHGGWSIAVRNDSNIEKVQDLRGKKCGWIPGSVMNKGMEALLAYGNLNWDDVTKVKKSGYGSHIKALLDGSVDAASGQVTSPVFYEVASGPHGLRWLNFDPKNKDAISRVKEVLPMFAPMKARFGANISKDNPIDCFSYPYPGTIAMKSLDKQTAKFFTKAIHQTYPIYSQKSKMLEKFWTLDAFLNLVERSDYIILHPGTIEYLKEIGEWKKGWDKEQKERRELQNKVIQLWEKVVNESYEKEIPDDEFPDYWNKRRNEKFGF